MTDANTPHVENISDRLVDEKLDLELRKLLTICFTKAQDVVFREHRHFKEPPYHRWMIRNDDELIAHITIHDKIIEADDRTFRIGGIAEVCVHPDHRGQGHVKTMLAEVHNWLEQQAFDFAMLFGNPDVYTSSGYAVINNVFNESADDGGNIVRKRISPMIRLTGSDGWPSGDILLPGMTF